MLNIPEEIKALFRSDNNRTETHKKFKLTFYDDTIESLYPYETLFPDEGLFPSEHGEPWLVIENDKIVSETLQITEALSSDDDIVFGSCEGTEMQITVADINQDIVGREFTLTVEIGGYEMALGLYTVKSFERQSDRRKRKITAYDRMNWFNVDVAEWYNDLVFPMTLKSFRDSLCSYVGITQNPDISLILDSMQITKTISPEQISGIDVLTAICEINGCFGHIDKTGQLVYVQLQQTGLYPSETLYPEEDLYPSEFGGDGMPAETISTYKQPMVYEDYLVEGITGLTIRQEEGDVGASVGTSENVYAIEGNFLVYGKSAADLLDIANSILPHISGKVYRPASLDCNCMPWLEVGDALIVPTKDDVIETFLMKRTISGCQNMRDKIESTGSQTREEQFTIQRQITQLEGKSAVIVRTVEEVSATVTDLAQDTAAKFEITAEQISSEVTRATNAENQLSTRITQTATEIRSEVEDTANDLQSQITQTANQINLKVSKGDVSSQLSIETDGISIKGNRFSWQSTYSSMTADGKLTATSGTFSGNITGATMNLAGGKFIVDSSGGVKLKGAELDGCLNTGSMGADVINANSIHVSEWFEVDSDSNFAGEMTANDIYCDYISCRIIYSSSAGSSWSDRRLKHNIEYLDNETSLKIVESLKPVSFILNELETPGMGFIAQDVMEVCKQHNVSLPLYNFHNGYYMIPYTNYIAILTSAIQNLQNQINNLKGGKS